MGYPSSGCAVELKQQAVKPCGGRGGKYVGMTHESGVGSGGLSSIVKWVDAAQTSQKDNPLKVVDGEHSFHYQCRV